MSRINNKSAASKIFVLLYAPFGLVPDEIHTRRAPANLLPRRVELGAARRPTLLGRLLLCGAGALAAGR